jgi:hypothetical protein
MSSVGAAPRAAVAPGAPGRAATPVSNARAEASRRNGAKSRGPKTPEGKARAAQNALRHGMRSLRYVVLPDESAADFHALEEAMVDELAPVGAVQAVLARRVAVAAWRMARADRMEVELFEERRWEDAGVGMALIRDGNGTRSFETLMRYRAAAMAEFMRSLRTLKALQAEQAAERAAAAARALKTPVAQLAAPAPVRAQPPRATARPAHADPSGPNEPKKGAAPRLDYVVPDPSVAGPTLHEPAACWLPNEPASRMRSAAIMSPPPGTGSALHEPAATWMPNEPDGCLRQAADARPGEF